MGIVCVYSINDVYSINVIFNVMTIKSNEIPVFIYVPLHSKATGQQSVAPLTNMV